jgi:hypothetical protein
MEGLCLKPWLPNSRTLLDNTIGGSINNAVHISKHQNETRLMVSNNDYTIKGIHILF